MRHLLEDSLKALNAGYSFEVREGLQSYTLAASIQQYLASTPERAITLAASLEAISWALLSELESDSEVHEYIEVAHKATQDALFVLRYSQTDR